MDILLFSALVAFVVFVAYVFIRLTRPKRVIGPGGVVAEYGDEPPAQNPKDDPRVSLMHHRFFKLMEAAANPAFFISEPYTDKCAVNTAFLGLKFSVFREGMRRFFSTLEANKGDGIGRLPETINELILEYEHKAEYVEIKLPNGSRIYGVPESYLGKFAAWHAPHTRLVMDGINSVLADRIYPDWWARSAACLEYLYMSFSLTMEDAERTLVALNGDLDLEIAKKACRDKDHV
jgi:hypothetical protein